MYNCYPEREHIMRTAPARERKAQSTTGEYGPNPLGYTRAAMLGSMRCDTER